MPSLVLFGDQRGTILVPHLDSELLTVPGVYGPDLTLETDLVGRWVHLVSIEDSPEGMTMSALAVATPVDVTLASPFSGSAVILPQFRWRSCSLVVVSW